MMEAEAFDDYRARIHKCYTAYRKIVDPLDLDSMSFPDYMKATDKYIDMLARHRAKHRIAVARKWNDTRG